MSTTFTWNVVNLERETSDGYVYTVHYTVNANDGTYSAGAYGSLGLEHPPADQMIPYADLTEGTVIRWVFDKFGDEKVTEICEALQAQLDEQRAPTKASGLPWTLPNTD